MGEGVRGLVAADEEVAPVADLIDGAFQVVFAAEAIARLHGFTVQQHLADAHLALAIRSRANLQVLDASQTVKTVSVQ